MDKQVNSIEKKFEGVSPEDIIGMLKIPDAKGLESLRVKLLGKLGVETKEKADVGAIEGSTHAAVSSVYAGGESRLPNPFEYDPVLGKEMDVGALIARLRELRTLSEGGTLEEHVYSDPSPLVILHGLTDELLGGIEITDIAPDIDPDVVAYIELLWAKRNKA